ncbi:Stp1/IreP family PP2C-type Ser/Thr phosphatase [Desulfofalx alkaliphila]|uniref:Stp1/IreP family PP2C-type Ser/Thr phosphatase n=1 Tax=Desulfofalx alkaliphila TaxID=105483 RepID=UPI0004E1F3E6|nr:Stp1/IreP family PP2C-type Ser/Thr phosphatase [Desulfofalx alkaliphila]
MRWSQITEVGLVRSENEDSLLVCPDIGLFVVADGMGGHQAGEVASRQALVYLERYLRRELPNTADVGKLVVEAMEQANRHVYEMACNDANLQGMGTTVTACLLSGDTVYVAHVGDSRAYLLRGNTIKQVTDDHSLVGELVKNGSITEDLAQVHPRRNVLTQAVGAMTNVEVDLYKLVLYKGDRLLLCTDGLTNHLVGKEIHAIVSSVDTPDEAVKKLANAALEQGGTDNVSIILIEI